VNAGWSSIIREASQNLAAWKALEKHVSEIKPQLWKYHPHFFNDSNRIDMATDLRWLAAEKTLHNYKSCPIM
jgi:hypothetical protein